MPRLEVCSKYFLNCNCIDVHNQTRQFELRLEKHWITHCGYFRIITTLIGMTVCDCWRGYRFHLPVDHQHKNISVIDFASILGKDCLYNNYSNVKPSEMMLTIGVPSLEEGEAHSSVT